MATLAQLRDRLSSTWQHLAEGWSQLRRRAAQALTRFTPARQDTAGRNAGTDAVDQALHHAPRWGLLTADVWLEDDAVVVTVEIPGMDKNDFDIRVEDDFLVIRGTKHLRREHKEGHYYRLECAYGAFERAIALPVEVDEQQAKARYRHGVLQIRLPRRRPQTARRVAVQDAGD